MNHRNRSISLDKSHYRRAVQTVLVTTLAAALVLIVATLAMAKGPESATITGPDIDQPIELTYNTDPDMSELLGLTGLWFGETSLERLGEAPTKLGDAYSVAWVNSGPPSLSVEARTIVQYVYLDSVGGPAIHTPVQVGLDGWGAEVIGWFRAPAVIGPALEALGVPVRNVERIAATKPTAPPVTKVLEKRPSAAEQVAAAAVKSPAGTPEKPGSSAIWWVLPLAALVAVGLTWRAWRNRSGRVELAADTRT